MSKQYLLDNSVEEDGSLETKYLVFTGARKPEPNGYGNIYYEGRTQGTHRIAWTVFVGPIPKGRQINHLCNNPPCFRIEHLELGTHLSNMHYMWKCGRHPGSSNWVPKEVVLEARKMADEGHSQTYIAECLGLSISAVWSIVRGLAHADVGGPITIRPRSSRFAGVSFHHGKWKAQLSIDGRQRHLGRFGFEGDAAICYNAHVAWLGLNRPLNPITEKDWHHD